MKNKVLISGLVSLSFLFSGASFAGGDVDESEDASQFITGGALLTIAAPLVVPVGSLNASANGDDPVEASVAGAESGAAASIGGPLASGYGVVKLVEATGKGIGSLSEATVDELSGTNYNGPRKNIHVRGEKKTIPFVVREQYVQMNEPLNN